MIRAVRRAVAGHDKNGDSLFLAERSAPKQCASLASGERYGYGEASVKYPVPQASSLRQT